MTNSQFMQELQEQTDGFFLLNSLLNFEESPSASNETLKNVTDKDAMKWLDFVSFKEEQNYDGERSNPEKDSERKRKHNQIEKARRLFIDAKIRELGFLLPKQNEAYHELAKEIKHNKGGILKAAVAYLRILKTDQIKKQKIEERCKIQDLQKRKMMMKLQEYERDMKSYGISVKEFSIQDLPDIDDLIENERKIFLNKEHKLFKTDGMKTFDQLDDDMDPVSRDDPMFSSLYFDMSLSSTKLSRCSSTESTEDSDSMPYQQKKLQQKEKRKIKKNPNPNSSRHELYNTPRMPVVSRPFKQQYNLSLPVANFEFLPSNFPSMDFTFRNAGHKISMPPIQLSRSPSTSSEEEQHWSNAMFEKKLKSEENIMSPSPPPRPQSVIRKTASVVQVKVDKICEKVMDGEVSEELAKRKVILLERSI